MFESFCEQVVILYAGMLCGRGDAAGIVQVLSLLVVFPVLLIFSYLYSHLIACRLVAYVLFFFQDFSLIVAYFVFVE